jgi:hypothetical protein
VSSLIITEIKRMIKESEIMKEDDTNWPQKNKDGRQELEIRLGNEHISFEVGSNQARRIRLSDRRVDREDWIAARCHQLGRPRGTPRFLLSGSRLESAGLLPHIAPLQDQANRLRRLRFHDPRKVQGWV